MLTPEPSANAVNMYLNVVTPLERLVAEMTTLASIRYAVVALEKAVCGGAHKHGLP